MEQQTKTQNGNINITWGLKLFFENEYIYEAIVSNLKYLKTTHVAFWPALWSRVEGQPYDTIASTAFYITFILNNQDISSQTHSYLLNW